MQYFWDYYPLSIDSNDNLWLLILSTEIIMEMKGDVMVVLPCDMQYHVLV